MRNIGFLLLLMLIASCSASPKYLSESNSISKIKNLDLASYEHVELSPKIERLKKTKQFEYDLSSLDTSFDILAAVLELKIESESVMARSLGGAQAEDLSPIIKPTPYLGSRIKTPNLEYAKAFDCDIKYKASSLSILQRTGGTGGKAIYNSQGPGTAKYDITAYVKKSLEDKKPLSFSLTDKTSGLKDFTIFSSSYIIQSLNLDKSNGKVTKLIVYYK